MESLILASDNETLSLRAQGQCSSKSRAQAAVGALVIAALTIVPEIRLRSLKMIAPFRPAAGQIKARDKAQLAVSEEDGRFLRLMVASSGAKRALEIGGASGYSAIWIGMGLRRPAEGSSRSNMTRSRAKELAENVAAAGLSEIVQVVTGDAFAQIPRLDRHVRFRLPGRVEA